MRLSSSVQQGLTALSIGLSALWAVAPAAAQTYPNKPIRMVVPVPPGGGSDAIARAVAQQMSEAMKTSVVVDNKPGAGGLIGSDQVAKAAPDGYTILMINNAFVINPWIYKLPYDTVKDFQPITILATAPNLLVAHHSLPANNLEELIAAAKKSPGQITMAVSAGQMSHVAAALFEQAANIDLQIIPYKGAGVANNDLVAGNVMLSFGTTPTYLPMIKAGKLKPLGIGASAPIESLPNVQPIGKSISGFEANTWFGLFAPAGTPRPVVDRLRAEVVAALKSPVVQERMKKDGYAAGQGLTPEAFATLVKEEMEMWSGVVKKRGIKME